MLVSRNTGLSLQFRNLQFFTDPATRLGRPVVLIAGDKHDDDLMRQITTPRDEAAPRAR